MHPHERKTILIKAILPGACAVAPGPSGPRSPMLRPWLAATLLGAVAASEPPARSAVELVEGRPVAPTEPQLFPPPVASQVTTQLVEDFQCSGAHAYEHRLTPSPHSLSPRLRPSQRASTLSRWSMRSLGRRTRDAPPSLRCSTCASAPSGCTAPRCGSARPSTLDHAASRAHRLHLLWLWQCVHMTTQLGVKMRSAIATKKAASQAGVAAPVGPHPSPHPIQVALV